MFRFQPFSYLARFSSTASKASPAVSHIGVVGAGQMGTGIAYVAALHANLPVTLIDASKQQLEKSTAFLHSLLDKDLNKQKIDQQQHERVKQLIRTSTDLNTLCHNNADFIIEAVTESLPVKHSIFKQLDSTVSPSVILASNTSSISLTEIASVCEKNAERVIGMHFMNPVPVMKLVEVITALQTSEETLQTTLALAAAMNKMCTHSQDRPGFVANRLLMPYINEAIFALQDGIASRNDIDTTMKLGCNMPMGPLQLADLIGLDTCLHIMNVLHSQLGEDKYRPAPLLRNYVAAGRLGKKTGRGFYDY